MDPNPELKGTQPAPQKGNPEAFYMCYSHVQTLATPPAVADATGAAAISAASGALAAYAATVRSEKAARALQSADAPVSLLSPRPSPPSSIIPSLLVIKFGHQMKYTTKI